MARVGPQRHGGGILVLYMYRVLKRKGPINPKHHTILLKFYEQQ